MDETKYYEELEALITNLKKARADNDHTKITHYIDLLNALWKKGNDMVIKNPPPKL